MSVNKQNMEEWGVGGEDSDGYEIQYYTTWDLWWSNLILGTIQTLIYLGIIPLLILIQDVLISTDDIIKFIVLLQTFMVVITSVKVKGHYFCNIIRIWLGQFLTLATFIMTSYGVIVVLKGYSVSSYGLVTHVKDIFGYIGMDLSIKFVILLGTKMIMEGIMHGILCFINYLEEVESGKQMEYDNWSDESEQSDQIQNDRIKDICLNDKYEEYDNLHTSYTGGWLE